MTSLAVVFRVAVGRHEAFQLKPSTYCLMKKLIFLTFALITFGCLSALAGEAPKLLVVKNHADWCGSCKVIEPHFVDLQNKFDGKEVLFVTLDFTNETTSNQADLLAARLGADEKLTSNRKTGFISVLNESGEIVETFTKNDSLSVMSKSLASLL